MVFIFGILNNLAERNLFYTFQHFSSITPLSSKDNAERDLESNTVAEDDEPPEVVNEKAARLRSR